MLPISPAHTARPTLAHRLVSWLLPLLLMLPLLWALLPGGLPDTADGTVHFVRATEMRQAWQEGVWLPRWAENLAFGYGIPLFVYSPPLPYFLVAGLCLVGLPPEVAYKGMLLVGILIGGTGAYQMGRRLLGDWAGVVAAAAFLYAPIELRELFIQGNAAQYLAWAFPPWAAWAIIDLYDPRPRAPRPRSASVLALALMGTLLCHNAAALILMGMIALQGMVLWLFTRRAIALLWTIGGSMLGLALSAWFWVPALLEGKYVALDRIVASDYHPRFIALGELLAWSPRLDRAAINPYYPLTLGGAQLLGATLGVVSLALLLGALVFHARAVDPEQRPDARPDAHDRAHLWGTGVFMLLFALFCGFMATAWSAPLWEVLPFVTFFEWPFRWHGFTVLGLSWLCAAAVAFPRALGGVWRYGAAWLGTLLLALLIGSALVNLYPQKLAPGTRIMSPYEVARYETRSKAVGTTSLGEFNPIWVDGVINSSPLVEDYLARRPINRLKGALPPDGEGSVLIQTAHHQRYQITLAAPATVTLNLLYFPGWRARVDGAATPVHPAPVSGLLTLDLPGGTSVLDLRFGPTPLRLIMQWLSALAWLGLIGAAVWLAWQRAKRANARPSAQPNAWGGRRLASVTGVVALIWLMQVTLADRFQLTSPPGKALPAAVPMQVNFEDKLQLIGLESLPTTAAPGDQVTVIAYWRVLQDLDEDYSVFLHLDDPLDSTTHATADERHPGDKPTSDWTTGQYVRDVLKLTVPDSLYPIRYVLRTGFYDPISGQQLDVDGSGALALGRLWVEAVPKPEPPRQGPRATFAGGIDLLGVAQSTETITFYWRSDGTLTQLPNSYTIFVHLLDAQGNTLGQLDGAPYGNRYPLRDWQPDTVIADTRLLADAGVAAADVVSISVGIYDTQSFARMPVQFTDSTTAGDGTADARIADNALFLTWVGQATGQAR